MRAEIISVDFSDLEHGLGLLLEADSPARRMQLAQIMAKDLESLPRCTALDDFIAMLYPTLAFGDAPSPSLRDGFTQLVIAFSGWSMAKMTVAAQKQRTREDGAAGGRKKSSNYVTRNQELLSEYDLVRGRCHSNLDAATRMYNNGFTDSFGNQLSAAQILRIVRNRNK